MAKKPKRIRVLTPAAAAYAFGVADATLRQLAIRGKIEHWTIKATGWKTSRAFSYESLVARWGEPDPVRLALLTEIELLQATSQGATIWQLLIPTPQIEDDNGDLAVE